jgi:hypothetical protein
VPAATFELTGTQLRFGRRGSSGSALKSQQGKGVTDMQISSHRAQAAVLALVVAFFSLAPVAAGQNVTYKAYIQPGDNGPFGLKDQMVVAWQTEKRSCRTAP